MRSRRRLALIAVAAAFLAACGSSSTSSSSNGNGNGTAFTAIHSAFANYGTQSSAHMKITVQGGSNPGTFDIDVTKDALTGTATFGGQQVGLVYVDGQAYVQLAPGGAYTALPADQAKPIGLFTISRLSTCFQSFLGSSEAQFTGSVSSSSTTVDGTAGVDYHSPDGKADVVVTSGSTPLPLKLTGVGGNSSSSSSSSANPACDTGSSSSSSSDNGGTVDFTWSYPGSVTTITPPPTS